LSAIAEMIALRAGRTHKTRTEQKHVISDDGVGNLKTTFKQLFGTEHGEL